MGWEDRNGRSYYYRKQRDGGRVRSVYLGGGETAHLIAQLEGARNQQTMHKRELARIKRERLHEQEALVNDACSIIDTMTQAALLAAGFHTHKRQWRRRRHG